MGGESREGWLPFIRRQWDDFTRPSPAPPTTPVRRTLDDFDLSSIKPTPWSQVGPNLLAGVKRAGSTISDTASNLYKSFQDESQHPVSSNLEHGLDFYKNLWNKHGEAATETGSKILGRVAAVATDPLAKGASTLWDVEDPRNTGSEKKPLSDVPWEMAKAAKRGWLNPQEEHPELARELGQRAGPTFVKAMQESDPLGYQAVKFGLNQADVGNLGGEKLAAAAVGGLAHGALAIPKLLGMGATGAEDAMLPMRIAKRLHDIEQFTLGTRAPEGVERRIASGGITRGRSLNDISGRWTSTGTVSPEQVARATAQGRHPSSPISAQFTDHSKGQMPIDVQDPNEPVLDLLRPMPREDIDAIIATLHPDKDADLINKIERDWKSTQKWVVPDQHYIDEDAAHPTGPMPSRLLKENDPNYVEPPWRQAQNRLQGTLLRAESHGRESLPGDFRTGEGALNNPTTEPPARAMLHHDIAAGATDEDIQASFDADAIKGKRLVDKNDPKWYNLRRLQEDAQGNYSPAPNPYDKNEVLQNTPAIGMSPANKSNAAQSFKFDVAENSSLSLKEQVEAWHNLDPQVQQHYMAIYPSSYANLQKQLAANPQLIPGSTSPTLQAFDDWLKNNPNTSMKETAEKFKALSYDDKAAYSTLNPKTHNVIVQSQAWKDLHGANFKSSAQQMAQAPGAMDVHEADFADIWSDYDVNFPLSEALPGNINDYTPQEAHKFVIQKLQQNGYSEAADDVIDLWNGKKSNPAYALGPGTKTPAAPQTTNNPFIGKSITGQDWTTAYPNVDQDHIENVAKHANAPHAVQIDLADIFADDLNSAEAHALKSEYPGIYKKLEDAHNAEYGAGNVSTIAASAPPPSQPGPVASPQAPGTVKHDVFNQGSGETLATFNSEQEAKDWMAKHPESKYLDYGAQEPHKVYDKAKDFQDFTTKAPAVAAPTPTINKVAAAPGPVSTPKGYPSPATTDYSDAGAFKLKEKNVQQKSSGMGAHEKHVYTKGNQDYLFKPADKEYRSHTEVNANKIAELGGLYPIDIGVAKVGGQSGTMQAIVGNKTDWPSLRSPGMKIQKLTKEQLVDVIKNHPIDWLTANHDAHGGQWLITPQGVIEVDRGQAFKHFGDDTLNKDYNPNAKYGEDPSVYAGIHRLWKDGKLPQLTEQDIQNALAGTIGTLHKNGADVSKYMLDSLTKQEGAGKLNGSMQDMIKEANRRFLMLQSDLSGFWAK